MSAWTAIGTAITARLAPTMPTFMSKDRMDFLAIVPLPIGIVRPDLAMASGARDGSPSPFPTPLDAFAFACRFRPSFGILTAR